MCVYIYNHITMRCREEGSNNYVMGQICPFRSLRVKVGNPKLDKFHLSDNYKQNMVS